MIPAIPETLMKLIVIIKIDKDMYQKLSLEWTFIFFNYFHGFH